MFMKKFILFAAFFVCLFLPTDASAREAEHFYNHCRKSAEFNAFASIDSIPSAKDSPLTQGDNGKWVALYEAQNEGEVNLEVSGTVDDSVESVFLCEKEKIVAILPTYKTSESDNNASFKFAFKLAFDGTTVTITEPSYYDAEGASVVARGATDGCPTDLNSAERPFAEIESGSPLLGCIGENVDSLLAGLTYHEIYATHKPYGDAVTGGGFSLTNFENIATFNYAIFPPLETLSACNASSIANLSVEDIKCFTSEQQIRFKRYFLGLPELIQKLFDIDATANLAGGEIAYVQGLVDAGREFLVNYFNEKDTLSAAPSSGAWLDISANTESRYRYFKSFSSLEGADLSGGITSYYDELCTDGTCPAEYHEKCAIDPSLDLIAKIGTDSIALFPDGCGSNALPTDAAELLAHAGVSETNEKIQELQEINTRANELCAEIQNIRNPADITVLQAVNAAAVEITQYLADLDARYEGFGACEKISAVNTLSAIMDRTLTVLGETEEATVATPTN